MFGKRVVSVLLATLFVVGGFMDTAQAASHSGTTGSSTGGSTDPGEHRTITVEVNSVWFIGYYAPTDPSWQADLDWFGYMEVMGLTVTVDFDPFSGDGSASNPFVYYAAY